MKKLFLAFSLVVLFLPTSCRKDKASPVKTQKDYIFIGHCYDWNSNKDKVDPRIATYNLKQFDEIWLGGDVCAEASAKKSTLEYLDNLFGISKKTTLWAIGNHDIIDKPEQIKDFTHRDFFYTQHADGITKIVMNTNLGDDRWKNDCEYKQNQFDFILDVLDTLDQSSHLVMLMHGGFWTDVEPNMEEAATSINAPASWVTLTCEPQTWFRLSIFPKLQEIQASGIQVILISGDGGQYDKKYYHKTQEGIECYISGINNSAFIANPNLVGTFNTDPDSILIFHHNLEDSTLVGEFIQL